MEPLCVSKQRAAHEKQLQWVKLDVGALGVVVGWSGFLLKQPEIASAASPWALILLVLWILRMSIQLLGEDEHLFMVWLFPWLEIKGLDSLLFNVKQNNCRISPVKWAYSNHVLQQNTMSQGHPVSTTSLLFLDHLDGKVQSFRKKASKKVISLGFSMEFRYAPYKRLCVHVQTVCSAVCCVLNGARHGRAWVTLLSSAGCCGNESHINLNFAAAIQKLHELVLLAWL